MTEDYFIILFLYLLMGCLFAWNVVKTVYANTKKHLNWFQVLLLNFIFMAFWPLIILFSLRR
jgi:hypothetical protein